MSSFLSDVAAALKPQAVAEAAAYQQCLKGSGKERKGKSETKESSAEAHCVDPWDVEYAQ